MVPDSSPCSLDYRRLQNQDTVRIRRRMCLFQAILCRVVHRTFPHATHSPRAHVLTVLETAVGWEEKTAIISAGRSGSCAPFPKSAMVGFSLGLGLSPLESESKVKSNRRQGSGSRRRLSVLSFRCRPHIQTSQSRSHMYPVLCAVSSYALEV